MLVSHKLLKKPEFTRVFLVRSLTHQTFREHPLSVSHCAEVLGTHTSCQQQRGIGLSVLLMREPLLSKLAFSQMFSFPICDMSFFSFSL